MSVYTDNNTGVWYVEHTIEDLPTGTKKRTTKRGFKTAKAAKELEHKAHTKVEPSPYYICSMLRKEIQMMNVLYDFLKDFLGYVFIIFIGVVFLVTVFKYADAIFHGEIRLSKKNKYSGTMICGTNHKTGKPVYRVEFDIPLEDIPKNKKLVLRVTHTDENLGINQRLYDLESEGIRHDD